ncbi:MAG: EAL domain-containing protein [Sulfurimonas sp.]|uniref:EAL domain-containing protein n=1 Tax=Sulfurimonas sp. TaxID=2022749 RepID=UPI0026223FCA|nr:EAL domain-containing protein [Sulfurimonas sp.]MDD5373293.1 EAL domain-containing protein [Sulfurimonas sp.]
MENILDRANLSEDIILNYQPIVKCSGGSFEIYKYEVLSRLHVDGTIHYPNSFFEASKNKGLYNTIAKLIFCKSVMMLKENKYLHLSVNVCYSNIKDYKTRKFILSKLELLSRDVCSRLTFEILETNKIKDFSMIIEFIDEVRFRGAKIAMDDFGTEYANYDNLLKINFDYIKIAGELIKDIVKSKKHFNVVRSLMNLCHELEAKVIAEYVENEHIMKTLCDINCEFMQGYFFGKPQLEPAKILLMENAY